MFRHVIIGAAAAFGVASAAQATLEVSTTARGLFSNVRVIGQPLAAVGPIAAITGRTSPGYGLAGGVASFAAMVDLGSQSGVTATLGLSSGAIATTANANGTTPADTSTGSASATVDNLDIGLVTSLIGLPTQILSLQAVQVQSVTSGSRIGQVTTLSGQSLFSGLNLAVAGLPILSLGTNVQVAPNFVAYDLAGLKVTLNQQFASSYDNTRVLITNAIGISFTNYLLDGRSLSGSITVGQSLAEFVGAPGDPIPEPAGWTQLLAGFGLMGLACRRFRARTSARAPAAG